MAVRSQRGLIGSGSPDILGSVDPDDLDAIERDLVEAERTLERLDDGSFWTEVTQPVPVAGGDDRDPESANEPGRDEPRPEAHDDVDEPGHDSDAR